MYFNTHDFAICSWAGSLCGLRHILSVTFILNKLQVQFDPLLERNNLHAHQDMSLFFLYVVQLPTERAEDAVVVALPPPKTLLPREKPVRGGLHREKFPFPEVYRVVFCCLMGISLLFCFSRKFFPHQVFQRVRITVFCTASILFVCKETDSTQLHLK